MENTLILEPLRQLARSAHRHTSFDPEKRGDNLIKDYSEELAEDIENIKKMGGNADTYKEKYISFLSSWLSSKGNCYSVMITGPANFNSARHKKRNDAEHNKYEKFRDYRERALTAIKKANTESTVIVRGESDTLSKLEKKLAALEKAQETMKACNAIIRDKKGNKEMRLVEAGLTAQTAAEILEPDFVGRLGFPTFSLSNNNAQINKLRKDIVAEEARTAKYSSGNYEYEIEGVKVEENVEDNRIRLFFDGKPQPEMIQRLKSRGFRWSPSNMAWQRQLTNDAVGAAKWVLTLKN